MSIVSRIGEKHGIQEAFRLTETAGLANFIYMSDSYVLRIPSDHPEAVPDAYTESVAVPAVLRHGIRTRRLIAFDGSCEILDRPYSIWERVEGVAMDEESARFFPRTWFELGKELRRLHTLVTGCEDPDNYLDSPERDYDVERLHREIERHKLAPSIQDLVVEADVPGLFDFVPCFVHGDTNPGNIICSEDDEFLSLIDWGDSGWGDPAIDFYLIPAEVLRHALRGYTHESPGPVDRHFYHRILLDKIAQYLDEGKSSAFIEERLSRLKADLAWCGARPV